MDDDGGVEPVDGGLVREPGGRQCRNGVAQVGVVADGESEEVRGSGFWCSRLFRRAGLRVSLVVARWSSFGACRSHRGRFESTFRSWLCGFVAERE